MCVWIRLIIYVVEVSVKHSWQCACVKQHNLCLMCPFHVVPIVFKHAVPHMSTRIPHIHNAFVLVHHMLQVCVC